MANVKSSANLSSKGHEIAIKFANNMYLMTLHDFTLLRDEQDIFAVPDLESHLSDF